MRIRFPFALFKYVTVKIISRKTYSLQLIINDFLSSAKACLFLPFSILESDFSNLIIIIISIIVDIGMKTMFEIGKPWKII